MDLELYQEGNNTDIEEDYNQSYIKSIPGISLIYILWMSLAFCVFRDYFSEHDITTPDNCNLDVFYVSVGFTLVSILYFSWTYLYRGRDFFKPVTRYTLLGLCLILTGIFTWWILSTYPELREWKKISFDEWIKVGSHINYSFNPAKTEFSLAIFVSFITFIGIAFFNFIKYSYKCENYPATTNDFVESIMLLVSFMALLSFRAGLVFLPLFCLLLYCISDILRPNKTKNPSIFLILFILILIIFACSVGKDAMSVRGGGPVNGFYFLALLAVPLYLITTLCFGISWIVSIVRKNKKPSNFQNVYAFSTILLIVGILIFWMLE